MRYRIRRALITITVAMLLGSGPAFAEGNACKADLTGDLVVNFADLAVLKSVFFKTCSPTCGDGVKQGPEEQCDDGNVRDGDGCSKYCKIDVPPAVVCGDGIAQGPTEHCDDGNLENRDGCSSTCQIERPGTTSGLEDRGLTVFDHGTGLEWEKKDDNGGIHDKDNLYTWSTTGTSDQNPGGTAFTVFLAALNGPCVTESTDGATVSTVGCPGGGHHDWRLPTVSELFTIVDCSHGAPCLVDPVFGPAQPSYCWSSSSTAANPFLAWYVSFYYGFSSHDYKTSGNHVRAVRGGL